MKIFSILFIAVFLSGCHNSDIRENGWYYVKDSLTKELEDRPFMTVSQITEVVLEKDAGGNFTVLLHLSQDGVKRLEKATEASVGKYIAFLCDGNIISMPMVNQRISSEYMQVSHSDSTVLKTVYRILKDDIYAQAVQQKSMRKDPETGLETNRKNIEVK